MKKIIAILLSAIIITAALCIFPVSATETVGEDKVISLDVIDEKLWTDVSGVSNILTRKASGKRMLSVSAEANTKKMTVRCDTKGIDLEDTNELVLDLYLKAGAEKSSLTVFLKFESHSFSYDATVSSEESKIYVPLDPSEEKKLVSMTLTLDAKKETITILKKNYFSAEIIFC